MDEVFILEGAGRSLSLVAEAGSMISMPVPWKSDTLRVASLAPWERQTAAISASEPGYWFPGPFARGVERGAAWLVTGRPFSAS